MIIQRAEKTQVLQPKTSIETLEAGTVFKVGKKLFLKTNAGFNEGVRLTTGETQEFESDDVADEVVDGTFNYK